MNKFNARKVTAPDGQKFDSRKEYRRWCELKLMERAGRICDLKRQVKYELLPTQKKPSGGSEIKVSYIADFVYRKNGKTVVEDCKGMKTDTYILKRKLMLYMYGIEILET